MIFGDAHVVFYQCSLFNLPQKTPLCDMQTTFIVMRVIVRLKTSIKADYCDYCVQIKPCAYKTDCDYCELSRTSRLIVLGAPSISWGIS